MLRSTFRQRLLRHKFNLICTGYLKISIKKHHKLVTYDIKDLYFNIPITETHRVTEFFLRPNSTNTDLRTQIMKLLHIILMQNYFKFDFYQPHGGRAMKSLISGLIAEIFLSYFEHNMIRHNLQTKCVLLYARYVDAILIIFDESILNIDTLTDTLSSIHTNVTFTPSHETEGQINC